MHGKNSEPFTWSHFKWFVGFSTSIWSLILTGIFLLFTLEMKAHADKEIHPGALRADKYETDKRYLTKDLSNVNESLEVLKAQIAHLVASQMKMRKELLQKFHEMKEELQ